MGVCCVPGTRYSQSRAASTAAVDHELITNYSVKAELVQYMNSKVDVYSTGLRQTLALFSIDFYQYFVYRGKREEGSRAGTT